MFPTTNLQLELMRAEQSRRHAAAGGRFARVRRPARAPAEHEPVPDRESASELAIACCRVERRAPQPG